MDTRFDAAAHQGFINGRRVLSVTQSIEICGLMAGDDYFNESSRLLGDYIHQAAALDDEGNLDRADLHPKIAGYLDSWSEFRERKRVAKWILIERRIFSDRFQLTGAPDRLVELHDGDLWLWDLKHGGIQPIAHPLQTAGYKILIPECEDLREYLTRPMRRGAVYVMPDGKMAKIEEHKSTKDIVDFMAVHTVAQLKMAAGMVKE